MDGDRCLEESTLEGLGQGRLALAVREAAVRHLDQCARCRRALAAFGEATRSSRADTEPGSTEAPAEIAAPSRLGRYVLLHRVGAGAMGVVYAAYDPELDRRVALKLLHPQHAQPAAAARLLREAKALARLSHPNVVPVFDVGEVGGQLFVAMELVDGGTLRDWLRAGKRSLDSILDVFRDAGRGLAAAHAAGLVHRDFKPDNVLIGHDQRVRITDFGLVRSDGERPADSAPTGDPDPAPASGTGRAATLTRSGSVIGTPAYMAPEQRRGEPADARSDQFSWCVALHEALYDERPVTEDGLVRRGRGPAAAGGRVPRFVERALARGLAYAPADRFPTVDALLRAIEQGRGARRRRWIALSAVAAAALVVTGAGLSAKRRAAAPCLGAEQELAGAWDATRAANLHAAFAATRAPYAEASWKSARAHLDEYARSWVAMHTQACEATRVRGEQSAELLDLRMACLQRRRASLSALVDVLAAADAKIVESASESASRLPSLEECASGESLTAPTRLPADAAVRRRVEDARLRLAHADAEIAAGRYQPARAIASEVADAARPLGFRPLEAEALLALGRSYALLSDGATAESKLEAALWSAEASGHELVVARAAIALVDLDATTTRRHEQSQKWARLAEAAVERLGEPPELAADRLAAEGDLLLDEDRQQEAIDRFRRALALRERILGAEHPQVAELLRKLALALVDVGQAADARAAAERALALYERQLGPDHPRVARSLTTLATVECRTGKCADAVPRAERAVRILERAFGADHVVLVDALIILGRVRVEAKQPREAIADLERALKIQEKAAPEDPNMGWLLGYLSLCHESLGEFAAQLRYVDRALAFHQKILEPDALDIADDLFEIGFAQLELGAPAKAIAPLERALAITGRHESTRRVQGDRCSMTRRLVEALSAARRDPARARELAAAGIEPCRLAGDDKKADRAALERWVAAHGR